ncbi:hypothetical protein FNV43_RR15714 [Rhamnella rubrinervis]|uniref:Uncharacterized protein n=1 Tax=Rhamnella rubrinervis TaxID=2594499 RepID=A0A8K0E9F1_9ROSA|nr:hypothetical protein FNV43_RR15714 [Rhamnella rubrinervis]
MAGRRRMVMTIEGDADQVSTAPTDSAAKYKSEPADDDHEPDLDNHHRLPRQAFGGGDHKSQTGPNSNTPTRSLP